MQLIEAPSVIRAAGTPPKLIAEYMGRLNTGGSALGIAHMIGPRGWEEPGQTPEFDKYMVVLRVETRAPRTEVCAARDILTSNVDCAQYSTPGIGTSDLPPNAASACAAPQFRQCAGP